MGLKARGVRQGGRVGGELRVRGVVGNVGRGRDVIVKRQACS